MKRYLRMLAAFVVVVLVFAVSGCAYVHTKTPLDTNLHETELGTKIGTAQAHSIAWLVAWGDASYAAAARNGNITVLRHADQESFQVFFGFYTRFRVIVYGD